MASNVSLEDWQLTPKNWDKFQHYKDRLPTWIKLHRTLLDDYQYHCLPVASRALAPCIWLLAAEYPDGCIKASGVAIAFRLHTSVKELISAINPLIEEGFVISASGLLAACYQVASPEKRRSNKKEREDSRSNGDAFEHEFAQFYVAYPRHQGKGQARKAFRAALKKTTLEIILAAIAKQKPGWNNPKFIPLPASWLNGERWTDEPTKQPEDDWHNFLA